MSNQFYEEAEMEECFDVSSELDGEEVLSWIKDDLDVERLIGSVKKCKDEIEFLNKMKEKRVFPIDQKIAKLTANEEKLRTLILEVLPKFFPKKNSVDFPGVGKVTKRKLKGKWSLTDEDQYKQSLRDFKIFDDFVQTKEVVDKRKIAAAVAVMMKNNEEEEIKGVVFSEPEAGFSLSIELYDSDDVDKKEKENSVADVDGDIDF